MTGGIALKALVNSDREQFRAAATDALARFPADDRAIVANLKLNDNTVADLASAYQNILLPLLEKLASKTLSKKLAKHLSGSLFYDEVTAEQIVTDLTEDRVAFAYDEVLSEIYPFVDKTNEAPYQYVYASEFLQENSVSTVSDFFERYEQYNDAVNLSSEHSITLCDPHSSWLDRQRSAKNINKERSSTIKHEQARLDDVTSAMAAITSDETSIITQVINLNWQYVSVLDLFNKYQKQRLALPEKDRSNPSKIIKIFEKVTSDFREAETERAVAAQPTAGLKEIRRLREHIYTLLLEIFDLSNAQRNYVLVEVERYTKLRQERDLILLVQRNREQFTKR